ncbi:MAG: hypothetical protein KBA72_14560 [Thermoanaerobaculia bacterium]|nr:hypothetical protein [Thermoanaerobaculia bacterium]
MQTTRTRLRRLALAVAVMGLAALGLTPAASAQGLPTSGPDVTVVDVYDIDSYGGGGGFHGYAVGTTSCNIGDDELNWCNTTGCGGGLSSKQHPVIAQNLYRLKAGRFEQIGMSWLKHGFFATNKPNAQTCKQGTSCITPPLGFEQLGIGCTDTYWAGLNGDRPAGPRSQVDASTANFPYPPFPAPPGPPYATEYEQRVKVADADVDPAQNAGAFYWVEGQYVSDNDAAAGNGLNNASYRKATVSPGTFALNMEPDNPPGYFATVREHSAIHAWPAIDPTVELHYVDVPGAIVERFEVARKVTAVDGDTWHYEYAIHNVNSDRSARAFSVDFADPTPISATGFHDIDSHSGEPYSTADWAAVVTPGTGTVTWSTSTFAANPNANALRWATLYSFWFDADAPPASAVQTIELFKPGSPTAVTFTFPLFSDGFQSHNLTAWSVAAP